MFSAYVSTEDNNDVVNIKGTTCNCIKVANITKLAISIFLGKIIFSQRFYSQIYKKIPQFCYFSSDFDEIFTERLVLHS